MASKKPWRTLVIDEREVVGRFTRTQIQEVVRAVKEESERKAAAKTARLRKASDQSSTSKRVKAPAKQSDRTPRPTSSEGGRMARKKPWRTLAFGTETGRFTREQIDAAVLAVMAESERKAARARKMSDSVASGEGEASKPAKTPARQPRKRPKAA